jgi:hypothetical protein
MYQIGIQTGQAQPPHRGGTTPDVFRQWTPPSPTRLAEPRRAAHPVIPNREKKYPELFLDNIYPQTLAAYKVEDVITVCRETFRPSYSTTTKRCRRRRVSYPTAHWTMDDLVSRQEADSGHQRRRQTDQYGIYAELWDKDDLLERAIWGLRGEISSPDHTQTLISSPHNSRKA